MAARGLARARGRRPDRLAAIAADATADDAERDLELLGLVGLEDPPRPDAADAVAACRRAGIRVAMVTGDHPATARAIAAEVGLLGPDAMVLEGDDLPDDEQLLGALLDRDGVVVARVDARGQAAHRPGAAGAGPRRRDDRRRRERRPGAARGRHRHRDGPLAAPTWPARPPTSCCSTTTSPRSSPPIEQGRATFANIRRFLTYHLTDNVAELTPFVVWALSGGRFPLALGVLQILCLDIGTDLLPALALGAEPPDRPSARPAADGPSPHRPALCCRGSSACSARPRRWWRWPRSSPPCVAAGWRPGQPFPTGHALVAASGAAFAAVVIGQSRQRVRLPQRDAAGRARSAGPRTACCSARSPSNCSRWSASCSSRRSPTCSTRPRRRPPDSPSPSWPHPRCWRPTRRTNECGVSGVNAVDPELIRSLPRPARSRGERAVGLHR